MGLALIMALVEDAANIIAEVHSLPMDQRRGIDRFWGWRDRQLKDGIISPLLVRDAKDHRR